LQEDEDHGTDPAFHEKLNKALHAMAAHLHRYASELNSLVEILSDIENYHKTIHALDIDHDVFQAQRVENGLRQIASQLQPVKDFEAELEKKLQNILALVSFCVEYGQH
jgi:uncharacterized phage infection (PIP) family protein YhgE